MKRNSLVIACLLATARISFAQTDSPNASLTESEQEIVTAAKAGDKPQFNGAKVVGVHPGTALIQALAVSGERPMTFSASHLPKELHLDPETGVISGSLAKAGEYRFTATAKNAAGNAQADIKIICGDTLALTPPLGWNSYDAFGDSVTESEVVSNAAWMKEHLQPYGWDTIVVDFRWYDPKPTGDDRLLNPTRTGAALATDKFGRLEPAQNRFPSAFDTGSFKPLADKLHAMGLKFGIHVMRGIPRQAVLAKMDILDAGMTAAEAGNTNDKCPWCPDMFGVRDNAAGQAWYDSSARLWAEWGVDYIKVDDLSEPYHAAEIEMIRQALDKYAPGIVFSTSPGATSTSHAGHIAANANLWRISGDFWDRWAKLNAQFDLLAQWQGAGGAGHWPDADMIPIGKIAIRSKLGGEPHWTHFTREEQRMLVTLWALAPSPMMLGMNLPDNDDWTATLLTNPEVMAVNQDALGKTAKRVFSPGQTAEVWQRQLADGAEAVGLFNRTDKAVTVEFDWQKEGFGAGPQVRDLWRRKDLPKAKVFSEELPPHGSVLLRVK